MDLYFSFQAGVDHIILAVSYLSEMLENELRKEEEKVNGKFLPSANFSYFLLFSAVNFGPKNILIRNVCYFNEVIYQLSFMRLGILYDL